MKESQLSSRAVIAISLYMAAQMIADIASLKIGVVAGFAVDMGTFIYPVTFTLRDVVHKALGKKNTRILILMAALVNLLMVLYLFFSASVPSDPSWGLGNEFSSIFSPMWRIVIASILAEVISELADTEAYHWFVTRVTSKHQWLRVLVSNSVSVPLDNLVFALGAFAFILPWSVVLEIFVFNLIVKYGMTLLSMPLIYVIRDDKKTI